LSSDPIGGQLLLQLVLIALSALFTAAQTALNTLNESKLHRQAEEGDAKAAALLRLLEAPEGVLAALETGTVLASMLGSAFAADHFAHRLTTWLAAMPWMPLDAAVLHTICVVAMTVVLAAVTLVLGILAPKRAALQAPEQVGRFTCGMMLGLSTLLKPVVWLLTKATHGVVRLMGMNPHAQEEVTEEEILMMVDIGEESGAIETTEKEMIENIFEFNNLSAQDVMTHRTDAYVLQVEDDRETILSTIRESGCSRLPVYDEDMDDIIGVLSVKKYLLNLQSEAPKPIRELVREAFFVPETVQADALFRDMQKKKQHMAIVVDEYGGFSGLVTMEDLLEEIVGNIYDEFDPAAVQEIVKLEDNLWRVAGTVDLETLAEALDAELPLEEEYDTLGGLIFDQLATIPEDGARPELDAWNLHIAVELIEDHRVEWALVSKLQPEAEDQQEDDHDAD